MLIYLLENYKAIVLPLYDKFRFSLSCSRNVFHIRHIMQYNPRREFDVFFLQQKDMHPDLNQNAYL